MEKDFKYELEDGSRVDSLKDVRKKLGVSGRAIKHLFAEGKLKKVSINQENVNNDGQGIQAEKPDNLR